MSALGVSCFIMLDMMDSFLAFISSLAPLVNCVLVRETLFLLSVLLLQASSAVLAYSQELPFLCLS